jgi:type I restriction enzyme S subunit
MQGKLMTIDKMGEPASLLLEKIKAEKEQLIREKKIKKQKPLQIITQDEIPFEIPENWSWCRLGELLLDIKYGTSKSCDYNSNRNSRVLRIPNVSGDSLNDDDLKFTDLSEKEQKDLALEQDDILIIRSNGSRKLVGKTVLVNDEFVGFAYAGYLVRLRFNINLINARFLLQATKSNFFRDLIEKPLRTTVGINNINTQEISNLLVPLPPQEKQILIADKLDELILFLDSLNKNISESINNNELLLKQVLTEALGIEISKEKPQKETSKKERQRTSKYDPNTIFMEIVALLKKHGKLHAEELWKMSKYYGPKEEDRKIDEFYAELKKQIEMNNTVKESSKKGYLELI